MNTLGADLRPSGRLKCKHIRYNVDYLLNKTFVSFKVHKHSFYELKPAEPGRSIRAIHSNNGRSPAAVNVQLFRRSPKIIILKIQYISFIIPLQYIKHLKHLYILRINFEYMQYLYIYTGT